MDKFLKIDAHQHFWIFDPKRDDWITEEMSVIRRDYFPVHLEPLLNENEINGSVVIQANQSEAENEFLLSLSENGLIKGIVGWVDLSAKDMEKRVEYYSRYKKMKGFRHVLQGESERAFMLTPRFLNGIGKLQKFGFTYDILIYPDQLLFTEAFVKSFPNQFFILDHIAKPDIKNGEMKIWREHLKRVGSHENVFCKISGMTTQADWTNWKYADFIPFLDSIFEIFGTSRILYGSDWPVCELAGGYQKQLEIVKRYLAAFSSSEQVQIWGANAVQFYNL